MFLRGIRVEINLGVDLDVVWLFWGLGFTYRAADVPINRGFVPDSLVSLPSGSRFLPKS